MKTATVSEVKNRLSELLRRVRRGESVVILDRETPIARIEPIAATLSDGDERLSELERAGVLRRPTRKPAADILRTLPPMPKVKGSAVAAVLAERDEGR
ncbi:MAG: type II toxin-antitoxin system prevent-host-death family antitoxin [Gammaproteobacteria bacterium]|nr:type II toxin-antitoxin system prevent-host-death family antitoxin [Gammaproteobacteria bacterium]